MLCPLCGDPGSQSFHRDRQREYLRCITCALIFVPPEYFLSREAEKAEYDLHENSPLDDGYRRFLSRLFVPLNERLQPQSRGLDFGSGPGPTLSVMFEEAGHRMAVYDPFYAPDRGVLEPHTLDRPYDFISATEVLEHLQNPRIDLDRLWSCVRPGGWLGVMTKLALGREEFASWHYKNDRTHVCFFSQTTFRWLAATWEAELTFLDRDVILLQRARS